LDADRAQALRSVVREYSRVALIHGAGHFRSGKPAGIDQFFAEKDYVYVLVGAGDDIKHHSQYPGASAPDFIIRTDRNVGQVTWRGIERGLYPKP
jgi:hypothetical protein